MATKTRKRKPAARKAKAKSRGYRLITPSGKEVQLSRKMQRVLGQVAAAAIKGREVAVIPTEHELTTQQAADLLHVSRQYLVRLVAEGKLPATTTGSHRRLRLSDVMQYKANRDKARREALEEVSRLGREQAVGGYFEGWKAQGHDA